jgi:hypothetical protein
MDYSFLNNVFSEGNFFFENSNGNTINIGSITFNSATKERAIKCPKCKTIASEDTKEQTYNYTAFTCLNCHHKFYEHDELVEHVSDYIDLNSKESQEFSRLIKAINSDLLVREVDEAYRRCQKFKSYYGKTPQIYEWAAFTLFLTKSISFWVNNSITPVLNYLEQAKELDPNSPTYEQMATSIASRYYQGLVKHLDIIRSTLPTKPIINDKEISEEDVAQIMLEYNNKIISIRQEIFKYLKQIEICYELYPDIDFIKMALNELYGYNGTAWYKREFKRTLLQRAALAAIV